MSTTPNPLRTPPPPARETPAGEFGRLVEIMRILRSEQGCPWDRKQTWRTLAPYVLEEAYEVCDAIERDAPADVQQEVGDLLFEGVFLARVAEDTAAFTVRDALRTVNDKLIRRHPHVFVQPDTSAGTDGHGIDSAEAVVEQWDQIKARERAAAGQVRESAIDGLPVSLPALTGAYELGRRAAKVGFDWPDPAAVLDKVEEEITELRAELTAARPHAAAEELGDLLFALSQLARKLGIDPEHALRAGNRKFGTRFRLLERTVTGRGQKLESLSLDELENIWQQVKRNVESV